MFGQKIFGQMGGCGVQKSLNRTDPTVGQNKFVKKKIKNFCIKKFLVNKNLCSKKNVGQKNFGKFFWSESVLDVPRNLLFKFHQNRVSND